MTDAEHMRGPATTFAGSFEMLARLEADDTREAEVRKVKFPPGGEPEVPVIEVYERQTPAPVEPGWRRKVPWLHWRTDSGIINDDVPATERDQYQKAYNPVPGMRQRPLRLLRPAWMVTTYAPEAREATDLARVIRYISRRDIESWIEERGLASAIFSTVAPSLKFLGKTADAQIIVEAFQKDREHKRALIGSALGKLLIGTKLNLTPLHAAENITTDSLSAATESLIRRG